MPPDEQGKGGFVAAREEPLEKLRIFQTGRFGNPGGSSKMPKEIAEESTTHRDTSLGAFAAGRAAFTPSLHNSAVSRRCAYTFFYTIVD
jgi:hypothetical protein